MLEEYKLKYNDGSVVESEIIRFKKLSDKAVTPSKTHVVDAGYDLTATRIDVNEKYVQIGTDIAFEIPEGKVGLLFPRSSITKKDLMLKNSVGIIDASYRGEIVFRFAKNYNDLYYEFHHHEQDFINSNRQLMRKANQYNVGERIGQIVIINIPSIKLEEVKELSETNRGNGGFGSTGN